MNEFHYAVAASTDFIEVRKVGHWKVDFLEKRIDEKGVDTSFAVDMVTRVPAYDVALLISGDADSISSVNLCSRTRDAMWEPSSSAPELS